MNALIKSQRGLTLIEITITVGIMAMLAGIVMVGVNPKKQIDTTRNAQRLGHISTIAGGINHYAIDTFSDYPTGVDTTLRMLGTSATGCNVVCGPDALPETPTGINSFADDTITEFDLGTHNNTQAGASGVTLSASGLTAKTGTYSSQIFDAGSSATWNGFTWMPNAPYGKELPNSQLTETNYPADNAVMTSNVLLMHMNETSGTIADSSGNANTGTATSITYNQAGKLKTALSFNGSSSFIQSPNTNSLKLSNTGGSISLWIKPTVNLAQTAGMGIIRKADYGPYWPGIGGYGLEIYRATPGGNQVIKGQLGYNNGSTNPTQTITGTTNIVSGNWYHVAMVWNASTIWLYVNGVQDATPITRNGTATLSWQSATPAPLYIGHQYAAASLGTTSYVWFSGLMDEISLFNRVLTPTEVAAQYQRGALRPKLYARSCDDSACAGETFGGTDGTAGTYFSEENNATLTPAATFTLLTPANRYFQYQLKLDTDTNTAGPIITRVSGGNTGATVTPPSTATTEQTASACLNLSSALIPTYLNTIPVDPVTGDQTKTKYAVKRIPGGLLVRACTPDLGESIQVLQ